MKTKVIDAHLHLDDSIPGPAQQAAAKLERELKACGIARAVVLHLASQRWGAEEFAAAMTPRMSAFVNLDPREPGARDSLSRAVSRLGFAGLKLHPRLQGFSLEDPGAVGLARRAGELGVPVLVDAFPGGNFSPAPFAAFGRACPETRIILAHMGGHRVLDFLMLAKELANLYFDISFSLLYYRGSSVPRDMAFAMRSLRFQRVFYGSDYPDRPVGDALKESLSLLRAEGLKNEEIERIAFLNAQEFFGWKDV
jgi:predicted TIM-barrel fold metal-dependent hydrolase